MSVSLFDQLLREKRFGEAAELLKRHIAAAEIFDPANDETHGPYTDRLAYAILAHEGPLAFEAYWADLLSYFRELESTWGHLHKGHMYYRLGLARLGSSLAAAKATLAEALAEDGLAAEAGGAADTADLVMTFPSYVTLALLEYCEDPALIAPEEREAFFAALVPLRFDVMWGPKEASQADVRRALRALCGGADPARAEGLYRELQAVYVQRLPAATIGLAGQLVETLLGAALPNAAGVAGLAALRARAGAEGVIPAALVQPTFRLVEILAPRASYLGEHRQEHRITAPARGQIAVMLKILVDLAALRWAGQGGG